MSCVTQVKAALARFLFGCHTLVTVWRVVSQEEDAFWWLALGIIVIAAEGFYALCYRKGEELSWFCPSVFIYLASIVPAIWILELKTDRRAVLCLYIELIQQSKLGANPAAKNDYYYDYYEDPGDAESRTQEILRSNMLLDVMQIKQYDLEEAVSSCRFITISEETRSRVLDTSREVGLKSIGDIKLNITLKPEQWTRILEQVVLVVLILGRWLLPKGRLTRDQFSQMMLAYISMAADIVEVFEAFRESKVMLEPTLTYAILGVWSLSLVQFCLVLGAGRRRPGQQARLRGRSRWSRESASSTSSSASAASNSTTKRRKATGGAGSGAGVSGPRDFAAEERRRRIQMDMLAISASLVLQDGPFFCLRMTLIFKFRVISHMNIFFTCKNTLLIMLQVYRLLILCLERRPQFRRHSRIFSLIPQMSYAGDERGGGDEENAGREHDKDDDYNSEAPDERPATPSPGRLRPPTPLLRRSPTPSTGGRSPTVSPLPSRRLASYSRKRSPLMRNSSTGSAAGPNHSPDKERDGVRRVKSMRGEAEKAMLDSGIGVLLSPSPPKTRYRPKLKQRTPTTTTATTASMSSSDDSQEATAIVHAPPTKERSIPMAVSGGRPLEYYRRDGSLAVQQMAANSARRKVLEPTRKKKIRTQTLI